MSICIRDITNISYQISRDITNISYSNPTIYKKVIYYDQLRFNPGTMLVQHWESNHCHYREKIYYTANKKSSDKKSSIDS